MAGVPLVRGSFVRARRLLTALAVLAAATAAAGCASTPGEDEGDPAGVVRSLPDVTAADLARDLGLRLAPESGGRVALEAPGGARILLFPGTRIATVAGLRLDLAEPAYETAGELWIGGGDAAAIRSSWTVQVANGATAPAPTAGSGGSRTPIPARPPAKTAPAAPASPSQPAALGDNKPSSAEVAAWRVPLKRKWLHIVIHHSAGATGSAAIIDRIHRERGFENGLGYDFVIGNGTGSGDGEVEVGHRWKQQMVGAHARTSATTNFMNEHGIGICLVGDFTKTRPSPAQLRALDRLCTFLAQYCGIPPDGLRLHGELKSTECPGKYFPQDFAIRLPGGRGAPVSAK